MRNQHRLARLEGRLPRDERPWHVQVLTFRMSGLSQEAILLKYVGRLQRIIDDERADDAMKRDFGQLRDRIAAKLGVDTAN